MSKFTGLIFVLVVAFLAACSPAVAAPTPEPPCADQAQPYLESVDDLMARWQDAKSIVERAPRINLAGPVADLQAIRREAGDLAPPPCAVGVQESLESYMESVIQMVLLFMAKEPDDVVESERANVARLREQYSAALLEIGGDVAEALAVIPTIPPTVTPEPPTPSPIPATPTATLEPVAALEQQIENLLGESNRDLDERLTRFDYFPMAKAAEGFKFIVKWGRRYCFDAGASRARCDRNLAGYPRVGRPLRRDRPRSNLRSC